MKKGFTIVEIIFLLVIIVSFSIIIFEKKTGITLVDRASTT
jgi:type II secretory pathway pseudopilin PulG